MANDSNDSGGTQGALEEHLAPEVPEPPIDVQARIKEHKVVQWMGELNACHAA